MTAHAADLPPAISARQALETLNRAGGVLTGSLALDDTLRHVVALVVPDIADWCAVLVIQDDGTEHEITSGHPDPEVEATLLEIRRRRRRRTGGSESLAVQQSGEPILATDVTDDAAPDLDERELAVMARVRPRSYMVVPLFARGRILGSLTFLSTTEGRHYVGQDLAFAQTLAGRFALAIDNARLYDASTRSLALLDTLFDTAPVGLAFVDTDGRFVRVNEALAAINGRPAEEHVGRTVEELFGPAGAPIAAVHRAVVERGEPLLEQEFSGGEPWSPGELRHWIASFTPVRGPERELIGVGVVVIDITERRRLLEAERAARARADFLARAGALLDASLDYEETLRNVADIAVPEIADWCSIRILDADGRLAPVATAHTDPEKQELARELENRYPTDPDHSGGTVAVARTGVPLVVRDMTDDMLVAAIPDPDRVALVRALGLRSLIIMPLVARRRNFGVLTLGTAESARRFGDEDVQLAEELARRAGVAIENARLYTERTRIAHTLQARLLPNRLPAIPGARVAARYRAAGELNEVGGDFYDVFRRAGDEWALVVGDVSGKGAEGAAVTALARYTLRAAALEPGPPSRALRRLNDAMLREADTSEFVTVVLGYAAPLADGCLFVRLALGGHPPPFVVRAGGQVESVEGFGSILGVVADARLPDGAVKLAPGDTLLLYTDGVTEAGPRAAPLGEDGLAAILAAHAGSDPERLLEAVEQAAVAAQSGEPRDDIALLAVAVQR
ncbi:MAG TPA: SpoIIE family protein phosphatase [Solirubrobacteraceae bacterium]|nr:SpoIIE family protein phosphatase [Solirubrobacteraceae bacterium]